MSEKSHHHRKIILVNGDSSSLQSPAQHFNLNFWIGSKDVLSIEESLH